MPAAGPRSFIKLDEVNEARIKRGIIRGSMMMMLLMRMMMTMMMMMMMMMMMVMMMMVVVVKRRKIRKRMRMVEQLISLAGTYGWGALARK